MIKLGWQVFAGKDKTKMMQLRTNIHDELYERFDISKRSANSPWKMFHTVSLTETLTYAHHSLMWQCTDKTQDSAWVYFWYSPADKTYGTTDILTIVYSWWMLGKQILITSSEHSLPAKVLCQRTGIYIYIILLTENLYVCLETYGTRWHTMAFSWAWLWYKMVTGKIR